MNAVSLYTIGFNLARIVTTTLFYRLRSKQE
jgi:hypothetical protein